jgi:hypothetical protein
MVNATTERLHPLDELLHRGPAMGAPCCGTIMRMGSDATMLAHSFSTLPDTM